MHVALFKFYVEDPASVNYDDMTALLNSFKNNGQLVEYFKFPVTKGNFIEYSGLLMAADSLDTKYYNVNAWRQLKILKEYYQTEFEYEIVSEMPSTIAPLVQTSIADTLGFILYHGGPSPLRSLDNFYNVPLYLLPPTSVDGSDYFNIICWERDYEAIYRIWFRGAVEESYFFDQLTNCQSALTQQGMELCKLIRELTKKDCYFYLYTYPDRDEYPVPANCPKCNTPWQMENSLFDTFTHKCNNCFLIT